MTRDPQTTLPSAPLSSSDALCRDLMDGMHAASQPLTILRASLGSPDVAKQPLEELRKLVRRSSREVERLCVLFNYLQQFVAVESIKAQPDTEDLAGLLQHAVEGIDILFKEAGVVLAYKVSDQGIIPPVLADSSRFEQAVCGILLAGLSRAGKGDEVALQTFTRPTSVEITVNANSTAGGGVAAETKLSMALSAANLRSQDATMTWTDQPFAVRIAVPIATKSTQA